jgi:hypothetical protein
MGSLGGDMAEFNADKEYYSEYLAARAAIETKGWKADKTNRTRSSISTLFTKNGMGIWMLFGCEEDVRNELL